MTCVLIIGASRGIGFQSVAAALERGHHVRAFSRTAARLGLADPKLEKIEGDALSPTQVTAALEGVDAVVQAIGVSAGLDMVLKPVDLFSRATEVLLQAMNTAGCKRLITVTGFGAGNSRGSIGCLQRIPFRLLLGRAYDDKSVQEELIRATALDWVIARPGVLTNGPKTDRYRVLTERRAWRNGTISRADVADFLVNQIEDETYLRKTPVLIRWPL